MAGLNGDKVLEKNDRYTTLYKTSVRLTQFRDKLPMLAYVGPPK